MPTGEDILPTFAQHFVVKRVIAQQPAADPPALTKPDVAHQIVLAPGHRILVPRQVTVVILQRHEPAPFTAGEFALFIDQQVDIGVAPRREPALQLMAHFIADFTDGEQLRLLARRQAVIAHAGLAKLLRHFGKVPGVVIDLGSNPHIGQRILRWRGASGVAGGQRPDGNARQQQEKGQRWQQTEGHRHQQILSRLTKMGRNVSLSFFPCSRSPVGNSRNILKPVGQGVAQPEPSLRATVTPGFGFVAPPAAR